MASVCYANSSIILPDYGPCGSSAKTTFCCTPGQICLSNGLCATELGTFYSGGCTDKTYKASICPNYCKNAGNLFIVECPGPAGVKSGDFCCSTDGDTGCCSDASNGLNLAPSSSSARAITLGASGTMSAGSSALISGLFTTSASVSSSEEASTKRSLSDNAARAATTDGLPALDAGETKPLVKGLAAGIGSGVVLMMLISISLCAWHARRPRRRSRIVDVPQESTFFDHFRRSRDSPALTITSATFPPGTHLHELDQFDSAARSSTTIVEADSHEQSRYAELPAPHTPLPSPPPYEPPQQASTPRSRRPTSLPPSFKTPQHGPPAHQQKRQLLDGASETEPSARIQPRSLRMSRGIGSLRRHFMSSSESSNAGTVQVGTGSPTVTGEFTIASSADEQETTATIEEVGARERRRWKRGNRRSSFGL